MSFCLRIKLRDPDHERHNPDLQLVSAKIPRVKKGASDLSDLSPLLIGEVFKP